jgi:chromosome segregation ATPase
MAKVNFTKEHYAKMHTLAFAMLVSNETISTKMGQPLNIVDLMHTTTINTLNNIRLALGKQIDDLEKQDEWVATDYQQEKLEALKEKKELVNLIIGWKRYNLELAETKALQKELKAQLNELKESQKTPEDRIKELEAKLATLNSSEEF